jgi:hypothetical protein
VVGKICDAASADVGVNFPEHSILSLHGAFIYKHRQTGCNAQLRELHVSLLLYSIKQDLQPRPTPSCGNTHPLHYCIFLCWSRINKETDVQGQDNPH